VKVRQVSCCECVQEQGELEATHTHTTTQHVLHTDIYKQQRTGSVGVKLRGDEAYELVE
jgi:hypothetical protein